MMLNGRSIVLASILLVACGDDHGVRSLDDAYRPQSAGAQPAGSSSSNAPSSTATCGVSTDGLVAYLPLDGDTTVIGGSSLRAAPNSSPSFTSGARGQALAAGGSVRLMPSSSMTLSSWTACAWTYVSAGSDDLYAFSMLSGANVVLLGMTGSSSSCSASGSGSGAGRPFVAATGPACLPLPTGVGTEKWSLTCWAYDASRKQMTVYANGTGTAIPAGGGAPIQLSTSVPLVIAPSMSSGASAGRIDEVSIWGRALRADEIAKLAASPCAITRN